MKIEKKFWFKGHDIASLLDYFRPNNVLRNNIHEEFKKTWYENDFKLYEHIFNISKSVGAFFPSTVYVRYLMQAVYSFSIIHCKHRFELHYWTIFPVRFSDYFVLVN